MSLQRDIIFHALFDTRLHQNIFYFVCPFWSVIVE